MARKDNRWLSLNLFRSALPLFLMWFALALLLLVLSSLYRSGQLLLERGDGTRNEESYSFSGPNSENLILHVSRPKKLRIDPDAAYDSTLVVWLTGPVNEEDSTDPLSGHQFSFESQDGSLDLMDENGIPIPGIITLLPTDDSSDAVTVYLKVDPSAIRQDENLKLLIDQVPSRTGFQTIEIPVEAIGWGFSRQFFDSLFGFPTLIGGLLTVIAGFGLQQWKTLNDETLRKTEEEQKRKQKAEDEICQKIEAAFAVHDYDLAFELYQRNIYLDDGVNSRLSTLLNDCSRRSIKLSFDNSNFVDANRLYSLIREARLEDLSGLWKTHLFRTLDTLRERAPKLAKMRIDELAKNSLITLREVPYYIELEKGVASVKLAELLKFYPEIVMYSEDLEHIEAVNIKKGMDYLGINMNPFGSEKVEKDQRFSDRFDRVIWQRDLSRVWNYSSFLEMMAPSYPISLEHMHSESEVIVGVKGSGKTSIALLMAGLSLLSDKKYLPIYCKLSSDDSMASLLRKIASILVNYFVKNCWEFTEMPPASQSAIAALFTTYLSGGAELSFRLYLAGLSRDSLGNEFHDRLLELSDLASSIKLNKRDCAFLLHQICPPDYKKVLFLFDFQDNGKLISKENQEIVQFLQELNETDTLFKVFSTSCGFSSAIISQLAIPTLEISWDDEKIKKVLYARVWNSDAGGVGLFFDRFDPSLRRASPDLLIQSSKGVPGKLIHYGNAILTFIGRNGRLLNRKDAEEIFGKSRVQKAIRESTAS